MTRPLTAGPRVALPPTRRVHHGHVRAVAIALERRDPHARATIVSVMRAGDTIERFADLWILRRAVVERVDTSSLAGMALVDDHGVTTGAPLGPSELSHAKEIGARYAIPRGGEMAIGESEGQIDPASWLDVSDLVLDEPSSLGAPPAPIEAAPVARAAREALGVGVMSAESAALARALMGRAPMDAPTAPAPREPSWFERWFTRAAMGAAEAVASLVSGVRRLFGAAPAPPTLPPDAGRPRGESLAPARPPRAPGLLARLDAWLREHMRRLGWQSLGRFLARKHAEHLEKLLEHLERQDLDEALKHAIPLSNEKGGGGGAPPLSLPSPRADLTISSRRAKGGGAVGLGGELFEHLRQRYRALYQQLLQRERWKDAAFVLAELLDDAAGAVALLEKHGFLREAAELAEGRELSPPIVVRQWLLARELARAVSIARRHDAFAAAISRMRSTDREAARALAIAWADLRARSGDYLGAITALETGDALASTRGLAARWAERAVEAGGPLGAEALVWLLQLDGDAIQRVGPTLEALLRDDAEQTQHVRQALYGALFRHRHKPVAALSELARFAWRAALRDRALFGEPALAHVSELETLSRDRTLAADRPVVVPRAREKLHRLASPRVVVPSATGAFEVIDAAVLPDGRVLVALGEAGLRVLAADGRVVATFDVPTDAIVLSDEGTRALSVSRRGSLAVVHRIDTVQRRAGDRFELVELQSFARSFDGERWAVVLGGIGEVLDVAEETPRSLFRVRDTRVCHVERSTGHLSFVASSAPMPSAPSGLERLRFDEAGLVLRERRALPERFGMEGRLIGIARFEPDPVHVMLAHGSYYLTEGISAYPGSRERHGRPKGVDALEVAPGWVALIVEHAATAPERRAVIDVVVLDRQEQRERLVVTVDDGVGPTLRGVGLRVQMRRGTAPLLVVFDSRGRVIAVELDEGRVVLDVGTR